MDLDDRSGKVGKLAYLFDFNVLYSLNRLCKKKKN